jgi:hypothetical protein
VVWISTARRQPRLGEYHRERGEAEQAAGERRAAYAPCRQQQTTEERAHRDADVDRDRGAGRAKIQATRRDLQHPAGQRGRQRGEGEQVERIGARRVDQDLLPGGGSEWASARHRPGSRA